jgi:hypothetical protein
MRATTEMASPDWIASTAIFLFALRTCIFTPDFVVLISVTTKFIQLSYTMQRLSQRLIVQVNRGIIRGDQGTGGILLDPGQDLLAPGKKLLKSRGFTL